MGRPKKPAQIGSIATDRQAVTLDESGRVLSPTPKRAKHIKLATVQQVADELARLYRQTRAGGIETAEASRLTYMLNTLAGLLETADLEQRVQQLEQSEDEGD
jgi:hypothetical protein